VKSLLDTAENEAVLARIQALSADTKPQFGTMGPAQMLAHCCVGFELASGQKTMKRMFLGRILGGFAKKVALGPKPFKQGLPTAPAFIVRDERDFATEQTRLTTLVRDLAAGGAEAITRELHPFFGRMTPADWDLLMWKHVDHHLGQFGA